MRRSNSSRRCARRRCASRARDMRMIARRWRRCSSDLPLDRMLAVVRAFAYFLQLSNVAEDAQLLRDRRAPGASPARRRPRAPCAHALDVCAALGPEARRAAGAVLRRRTDLTRAHRAPHRGASAEHAAGDARHRRAAGARATACTLTPDEVTDERRGAGAARAHHVAHAHGAPHAAAGDRRGEERHPLLHAAPSSPSCRACTRRRKTSPATRFPDQRVGAAALLRVGSWIGGDRDGNPFVTAETLRETVRLQSAAAFALLPRRGACARRGAAALAAAARGHAGAASALRRLTRRSRRIASTSRTGAR